MQELTHQPVLSLALMFNAGSPCLRNMGLTPGSPSTFSKRRPWRITTLPSDQGQVDCTLLNIPHFISRIWISVLAFPQKYFLSKTGSIHSYTILSATLATALACQARAAHPLPVTQKSSDSWQCCRVVL